MRFTPKSEQEIAEDGMIPTGAVCDFEVIEAEETTSKAGNQMIALKLKVWRPNGGTTLIRDWLLADAMWKLRAFAVSTDMLDAYENGHMSADDMAGKCGRAKIGVKPANGDYPPANKILSYEKGAERAPDRKTLAVATAGAKAPAKSDLDDEIPF